MQGWDMLGHSYMIMGRYVDALRAFEHARALSHDANPQYLAGYAEALALSHPDDAKVFMDQALPVFDRVLQMDPNNTPALWYGGMGALQRGDKTLAFKRWNTILTQDPPADYRAYIEKAITDAGGKVDAAAAPTVFIGMRVSLAPALAAKAPSGATVFVYAQPKGDAGGPPLAVRRIKVDELPLDIRLSDQDAVLPGRVLSAFEDAIVTARISLSGDATPHAGDLMGQGEWIKADGKPVAIVIDTVVK
jgi:cytochrome c-type biogenesis protein CcmH